MLRSIYQELLLTTVKKLQETGSVTKISVNETIVWWEKGEGVAVISVSVVSCFDVKQESPTTNNNNSVTHNLNSQRASLCWPRRNNTFTAPSAKCNLVNCWRPRRDGRER